MEEVVAGADAESKVARNGGLLSSNETLKTNLSSRSCLACPVILGLLKSVWNDLLDLLRKLWFKSLMEDTMYGIDEGNYIFHRTK